MQGQGFDLFVCGENILDAVWDHPRLVQVRGDIRDMVLLEKEVAGSDAIIHLACISNDPSFELNPLLGKPINYDAFFPLVKIARKNGV